MREAFKAWLKPRGSACLSLLRRTLAWPLGVVPGRPTLWGEQVGSGRMPCINGREK